MLKVGPKVVVILGPTGVGKSVVALKLAQRFDAEIVSFDSMQVYRHLDVGTAKVSREYRRKVPHHMIDVADPDERYHAARYMREARGVLAGIDDRGKGAIVVGGTGLYLRALLKGLFPGPAREDNLRGELLREARELGPPHLHRKLARLDPERAARVHENDLVRIVRALEVHHLTGVPMSAHIRHHRFDAAPRRLMKVGLICPRWELYGRIESRVERMFASGLVDEVDGLLRRGYSPDIRPFESVTYRPVVAYLHNRCGIKETVARVKRETRRYAKRQITWFRGEEGVRWIDLITPGWEGDLMERVSKFWEANG